MLTRGLEGVVTIRTDISETGTLLNPEVVENTNDDFREQAFRFFKSIQFKPPQRDGRPVGLSNCIYPITFLINARGGRVVSSSQILNLIKKTEESMRAGDRKTARDHIDELYTRALTLNDYAIIYALDADWMIASNRFFDAVRLYGKQGREIDPLFHVQELQRKFRLQAKLGLYGDAVATAQDLARASPETPLAPAIAKAVANIKTLAASDQGMSIELRLDGTCYWRHECAPGEAYAAYTPMRRKMHVVSGADQLTRAEAQCVGRRVALDTRSVWVLPPELGDCTLHLVAPPGTMVKLTEHHLNN